MIAQPSYLSPKAYIEAEKSSPVKHEYHDGQVFATAGASDAHVTIVNNVSFVFKGHLRGKGCLSYSSDMKVRIEDMNRYYYPDLLVTCDDSDRQRQYEKQHPTLIVKVLSNSTEAFDRGDKFHHYQRLETLQEYVLVSQRQIRVEVFRKNQSGLWVLHTSVEGESVTLTSIDLTVNIAAVYEDVVFSTASA
ncbi:MAG: Uma2 family endonuclease [Cyanobacteria bacterium P01_A01_bin.105]